MMAEINSELQSIQMLLNNNNQFRIPDFQRDFVWSHKEIECLFADFREDTDDFKISDRVLSGYLLGNIVLIRDENDTSKFDVIDGQQRLTTLTLIFHALGKLFKKLSNDTNNPSWINRLANTYKYYMIVDKDYAFMDYKISYSQDLDFSDTYKEIINPQSGLTQVVESKCSNSIHEVYCTIEEELDKISQNNDDLIYFFEYLTDKVKLIVTTAPSIESAFQLFEILNNRGKSLEPMDLLKNHLLKVLHNRKAAQNTIYQFVDEWNQFIMNLKLPDSKKNIDKSTFVRHFILGTRGVKIEKKKLFEYYRQISGTRDANVLKLVNGLQNVSNIYASIEANALKNNFLNDNDDMYIMFGLLDTQQIHSLLIPFYNYSERDKRSLVTTVSLYVAAVVFSFESPNKIEKELPGILSKILNSNFQDRLRVAIDEVRKHTIAYIETIEALLPTKDFSNSSKRSAPKALQILKFIELKINDKNRVKNDKAMELEHIMPCSDDWDKYDFGSEEERMSYLNRLGNLTLLDKGINQSAGNRSFKEKAAHYSMGDGPAITRIIVEPLTDPRKGERKQQIAFLNEHLYRDEYSNYSLWGKNAIDDRSKRLVTLLVEILRGNLP